jgi:tetratricopeptide (TPR) repeat protein
MGMNRLSGTLVWPVRLGVGLGAAVLLVLACTPKNDQHPETLRHQVACQQYLDKAAGEAEEARQQEALTQAESRCRLCLEYDKANPECLNLMGLVWYLRGNFDEARDWYKRAMRSKNDFPEARNNMGILHMQQKPPDYDEAITMFSSAIKIDPGYQDGRWNLALAYSNKGNIAFAEADKKAASKRANKVDPKVISSLYADAESNYARCDEQLRRLFELNPKNFQAYFMMGYIELQRSNYAPTENARRVNLQRAQDMGLRCWELAPRDRPEAKQCAGTLGAVFGALAQDDQSMTYWMSCLSLDPKEPECLRGFQEASARVALTRGGLKKYLDQIAQNPGYAQGYFNLCVGAFEQNLQDIGASACEQALQLDENICLAHHQLGKHYRTILNQERAIASCRKFVSCAGTLHPAEVQECKDMVAQLEMQ